MDRIELAKWLHENYEAIAKDKKWNTQENCKVEFDTLPDANKSTMIEIADRLLNFNLLSKHFVSGSFLADEFHEWIELNDWQFNPVSFNGVIKYRWVNETYSGQATTNELYDIFLSQNGKPLVSCSSIPKGWYVAEAGQNPLHMLWFVVLVNFDDVASNIKNPRHFVAEECDSFEQALHECVKNCN